MSEQPPAFDFELLDDVLPSIASAADPLRQELIRSCPTAIGPVVEYAFQLAARPQVLPPLSSLHGYSIASLGAIVAGTWERQPKTTALDSRPWEFSCIPPDGSAAGPYWTAFLQRVKHAGQSSGFGPNLAKQFAGVVGEMVDNVWQHSDAPATAIVGYRRGEGEFEFVVADAGVGVVASLNRYPEFAGLTDAGTALLTALTLADTPYGRRTGRGEGYRRMFANLANRWGSLRFRSGDHGLNLDGTSPDVRTATAFQTCPFGGFLLALTCRP